jgi:hypothetical protein
MTFLHFLTIRFPAPRISGNLRFSTLLLPCNHFAFAL